MLSPLNGLQLQKARVRVKARATVRVRVMLGLGLRLGLGLNLGLNKFQLDVSATDGVMLDWIGLENCAACLTSRPRFWATTIAMEFITVVCLVVGVALLWTAAAEEVCPPGFYRSVLLASSRKAKRLLLRINVDSLVLSPVDTIECEECPAGTYGDTFGLLNRNCSGLCAPGFFGNVSGQASMHCSGMCTAGYVSIKMYWKDITSSMLTL